MLALVASARGARGKRQATALCRIAGHDDDLSRSSHMNGRSARGGRVRSADALARETT
jgi:hypothetical protein